jgi:1,4-alpha-glucan branching enzyme
LHQQDCHHEGFEWIDHHNSEQSILSFVRKSKEGKEKVYVVSNFTPIPREQFNLGVLDEGEYELLLSSDDETFWGSDFDVANSFESVKESVNDRPFAIKVSLPPLATIYLKHKETD